MGKYWAFELAVFRDAWGRTWRMFIPTVEHAPLYVGLFIVGGVLDWLRRGLGPVLEDAQVTLTYGVMAIGAGLLLTLAFNLAVAPYRLWKAAQGGVPKAKPPDALAAFIEEARQIQVLIRRKGEEAMRGEFREWRGKVSKYLKANLGRSYAVLFSDFAGLTQFADPNKQKKLETDLNFHVQRLAQFIQKLQT